MPGSGFCPADTPRGGSHADRRDGVRGRDGERLPRRRAAQAHQPHRGDRRQLRRIHEQVHHPPGMPLRIPVCLGIDFLVG